MQAMYEEEKMRNDALKATLAKLKAPATAEPERLSDVQLKASSKLKVIDLQEKELKAKQKVEQQELQLAQLQAIVKDSKADLKAISTEIDKERSSGQAVWETCGISTVSYRDPFHTGLSKRTPTGGYFTS